MEIPNKRTGEPYKLGPRIQSYVRRELWSHLMLFIHEFTLKIISNVNNTIFLSIGQHHYHHQPSITGKSSAEKSHLYVVNDGKREEKN